MATIEFAGYEIAGGVDFFAEGSEAYHRDAGAPYGAAHPEEVEGLLWAHYEWNLSRLAEEESVRAWALLVSGYEAARAAEAAVY